MTRPMIWPLNDRQWATSDTLVRRDGPPVPGGYRVDGASIPALLGFLWWLLGHPLTGRFLYPTVGHDYDCDQKTEPHDVVHRRLLIELLIDGVAVWKANLMYTGVAWFGPRWTVA